MGGVVVVEGIVGGVIVVGGIVGGVVVVEGIVGGVIVVGGIVGGETCFCLRNGRSSGLRLLADDGTYRDPD